MWEKLKEFYADAYLIFGWLVLFFITIMILRYGIVSFHEPLECILWIEILFSSLIIILGIERLFKHLRRKQ